MMIFYAMRTCAILSLAFVLGDRPLDAGMIFWTNEGAGTIQGARADGSGTTVARDVGTPQGIALGQATGQIYWTDYRSLTIAGMTPAAPASPCWITSPANPGGSPSIRPAARC